MALPELTKRILTGLVLAPLTIVAVYFGGVVLALYLSLGAGIAAWEFYRMAKAGGGHPLSVVGVPLAAWVPFATFLHSEGILYAPVSAVTVGALLLLTIAMFRRPLEQRPLNAAALTLFGVFYCGATLAFGYAIRYYPYAQGALAGTALVILPVWLVWSTDTGAYIAGRVIGGPKLAPSISPNKTISGALGGMLIATGMAWLYLQYVLRPAAQLTMTPGGTLLFAVCVSVAAQLGDLAESLIKREVGVKDASQILPGHGGVLDRLDSIIFALPVAYLLLPGLLKPAPLP
jgi:phosphatidate cytidylyltransferase